ncbi:MAG: aminoglycoside 6-N-acetyltransferase [Solirubrobacteraceae bacterium]|nr:aminoglycoside 6-N-acetyltransferase [Solirubrobacteraceae bacterium]
MPAEDPNAVTLEGARVLLRRARDDDRAALGAILREPEVARWWGPFDPETAFDELGSSFVVVVDGAVAGWLLFEEEDWWQYPHVSFDIALTTALHGRGYGREALRVAIRHFVGRGHHRFTIDPAADNARAIRTYASVGFKPVGVLRAYERREGAWHDGLLMDLLADELVGG